MARQRAPDVQPALYFPCLPCPAAYTRLPFTPASPHALPCSDKTVIVWSLTREEGNFGYARKALRGHSHYVQDVVISSDGQFCLSGSWDGTLRLWDINSGSTTRRFIGHTKDVLSVAFSVDNRQVGSWSAEGKGKWGESAGRCWCGLAGF